MILRTTFSALLLGLSATASADFNGDIDPVAAFDWINSDDNVILLDVRTAEEWRWVGHPGPNGLADSKGKGLAYKSGAGLVGKVVNISSKLAAVREEVADKTSDIYYTEYDDGNPDTDTSTPLPINPDFLDDVIAKFGDPAMSTTPTLLVMCKSGVRATNAAITLGELGFDTWNVEGGFEGVKNTSDYPGPDTEYRDVNGWRNAKLPWNQVASGAYNKVLIVDPADETP